MAEPHPTLAAGNYWSGAARDSIGDQARRTPEWRAWLGLLGLALRAADGDAWRGIDVQLAAARPAASPVLEGAGITFPRAEAGALIGALLRAAEPDPAGSRHADDPADDRWAPDPTELLRAAIQYDRAGLDRLAALAGLAPGVLATVAHFATLPLLLEAGRQAAPRIPADWTGGYCPVCGAWPTLVELRGLERRRVLRCGRCATGWARDVLHCPFCGERDHRHQGALVPEEGGELLRLETCRSCLGYIKCVTTLRPRPVWDIPLEDLRALDLELRALDRGFQRPERPGWPLDVALATAEGDSSSRPRREEAR
jgi:FdhE protein